MTAATKRVDRGRGHSYLLDGEKVDSVTGIIGDGLPKPALMNWGMREVAAAAWESRKVLLELERDAAVDMLKGAPYRDRDKAARRGTEVHRFSERLAHGDEVEVPEEIIGHVDAYLKFREEWQPTDELIERAVGNRKYRYMGTFDRVANLDGLGRCLYDVKTTRSGVFGDVALQLAGYRYAEFYLDDTGAEQPMPEVEWTGVLWLRADGYDLVPVTAGPEQYRAFLYCQQVAQFVKGNRALVGEALYRERTA